MKKKTAKKRLIQQIKQTLKLKNGSQIKFQLDYIQLQHPDLFSDCVADVLNEFGRNGMLGLDGSLKQDSGK